MINCITDLLKQMHGINGDYQMLVMLLLQYADSDGKCWPAHATLGKQINRTRQWVARHLTKMEELGLVRIERHGGKESGRPWIYRLKPELVRGVTNHDTPPPEPVTSCNTPPVTNRDTNKTQDSKTPPPGEGRVVNMPLPIPQGWCPSNAIVQRAMLEFPDLTDQDLADHTAKFITRCKAKGYTYADFDEAWLDWLRKDLKEAKEKASAAGSRYPDARDRREQRDRERAAKNRRIADEILDSIHGRRASR